MTPEIEVDRESCHPDGLRGLQRLPLAGTLAAARGRTWRVHACVPHADCAELHLGNESSDALVLLSPFDRVVPLEREPVSRVVRLRRWIAEMRRRAAGPKAGRLRAVAARADILPYQLAPALAAAAGNTRLLLADEVGLGKTIQAGWIVADILARHADARVLVAVPAGLRDQWREELSTLFAIDAGVADARWLRRTFADLPGDVNPWSLPGVYLTSIDFIKRPDVLRGLEREVWDALIVDEIHSAAAPTDRYAALDVVARRARHIVAISATPYSGDPRSFESISRLGATSITAAPPIMFRRSREDAGALETRRHRFVAVRIAPAEQRLQRLLARYTAEVWREASEDGDAIRLAMTVLRKRALSSPRAALLSLERRLDLLTRAAQAPTQLRLFDEEESPDDEMPVEALATPGLGDATRERRWLRLLIERAREAAPLDSKLRFIQRLVRRLPHESAILFTEYRDTLVHLAASFPNALLLHGGMAARDRAHVQQRFNAAGGLLLATDAASEGLNLQGRCRLTINYELPWNPARLEQRIGRVDRIGQRRRVHAVTLVARDTAEDLVIARITRRLQRIAATLGEHDRLAAFLDEARTARIVIGNAAAEDISEPAPLPAFARAPRHDAAAVDEAHRLKCLRSSGRAASPDDVFISSASCAPDLGEGFVFAVRWCAGTVDGIAVDTQTFFVHIAAPVARGRLRAEAARRIAAEAIARWEPTVRSIAASRGESRFAEASRVHLGSLDRLEHRERTLMASADAAGPVQPGLFDRRALQRATEATLQADARARDHHRRLDALDRSRPLTSRFEVVGILIVRRHRPA